MAKRLDSARRAELVAQRASFPKAGVNLYQCTDPACDLHQHPIRSDYAESMQAHFQEQHEGRSYKHLELLCKEDLCESICGTLNYFKNHRRKHKDNHCPVNSCTVLVNSYDICDHFRDDHIIDLGNTEARDARFYRECKVRTQAWEARTGETFNHKFFEVRERVVFDPDLQGNAARQNMTETDDDLPEASSQENDNSADSTANKNREALAAAAPETSASVPAGGERTYNRDLGRRASKNKLSKQTVSFLTDLFGKSEQLRAKDPGALYYTLDSVFCRGSFVNSETFREGIPKHNDSIANDCLMMCSSILWLSKIDLSATLDECLQNQLATIAAFAGEPQDNLPQYKPGCNDPYYDFLYGLFVRAFYYPDNDWFAIPGSEKLAQLICDLAPKNERDGMSAYTDKSQNMKPLVDSMRMNRWELTNDVWTDGLELWLESYGGPGHRTLGEYLCEVLEKEVSKIKLET